MKLFDIFETTTAGSIAPVSAPLGGTQKRAGTLFKGKKTKKPVTEVKATTGKETPFEMGYEAAAWNDADEAAAWNDYGDLITCPFKEGTPEAKEWKDGYKMYGYEHSDMPIAETRRMSAAEKLSRAFDRAKADREYSQEYARKMMQQGREEFDKKQAEPKTEPVKEVDGDEEFQDKAEERFAAQVAKNDAIPIDEARLSEEDVVLAPGKGSRFRPELISKDKSGALTKFAAPFKSTGCFVTDRRGNRVAELPSDELASEIARILNGNRNVDEASFDRGRDLYDPKYDFTGGNNEVPPSLGIYTRKVGITTILNGHEVSFGVVRKGDRYWLYRMHEPVGYIIHPGKITKQELRRLIPKMTPYEEPSAVREEVIIDETNGPVEPTAAKGWENLKAMTRAYDAHTSADIELGGEIVTLEYQEVNFVLSLYRQALKDRRHEEMLRVFASPYKFHKMMKKMGDLLYRDRSKENAAATAARLGEPTIIEGSNREEWGYLEYDVGSEAEFFKKVNADIAYYVKRKFGGKAWFNGGAYSYLIDVSKPRMIYASDQSPIRVKGWAQGLKDYADKWAWEDFINTEPETGYWDRYFRAAKSLRGQEDHEYAARMGYSDTKVYESKWYENDAITSKYRGLLKEASMKPNWSWKKIGTKPFSGKLGRLTTFSGTATVYQYQGPEIVSDGKTKLRAPRIGIVFQLKGGDLSGYGPSGLIAGNSGVIGDAVKAAFGLDRSYRWPPAKQAYFDWGTPIGQTGSGSGVNQDWENGKGTLVLM